MTSLNAQGTVFQPFADISYLDRGVADKFRTNMGFRKVGKMYDQFLLSASLANQLADGGWFFEDIGIVAFGRPMCMNDGLANRKPRCHSADEKDTSQVNFGPVVFSFRTSLGNTTMPLRLFGSAERRAYLALLTL